AEWEETRNELGIALNEADLLGFEVDPARRIAAATFRVLTLPAGGHPPEDRRVQMLFRPVGRVAASLRNGFWNDEAAEVVPFSLSDLLGVVQSFGGQPVYGWEFFDIHDKELARWGNRLSLDWRSGPDGLSRSIAVFQSSGAGPARHLDLCVWFDELEVRRTDGAVIRLEEFAASGRRWWDAMYAGDKRTEGHGIFPAGG
ncbi:MAG: hypothetical protein J2P46_14810, partial [Zavarzinella sp.]|nr:hypothetical protein [Zavarzinella sp.]